MEWDPGVSGDPIPIWRKKAARALVESCPAPYDRTLDAMLRVGLSTGEVYAAPETLARVAKSSRRTVLRHRTWLAGAGYVVKVGGGYRGRIARYRIPALVGKSVKECQSGTQSVGERVPIWHADPVVPAHVVSAGTTTNAYASPASSSSTWKADLRPLEDAPLPLPSRRRSVDVRFVDEASS